MSDGYQEIRDILGMGLSTQASTLAAVRDLRARARRAAQILIEVIGAPGPEYVDETAQRAADVIRELRARREKP